MYFNQYHFDCIIKLKTGITLKQQFLQRPFEIKNGNAMQYNENAMLFVYPLPVNCIICSNRKHNSPKCISIDDIYWILVLSVFVCELGWPSYETYAWIIWSTCKDYKVRPEKPVRKISSLNSNGNACLKWIENKTAKDDEEKSIFECFSIYIDNNIWWRTIINDFSIDFQLVLNVWLFRKSRFLFIFVEFHHCRSSVINLIFPQLGNVFFFIIYFVLYGLLNHLHYKWFIKKNWQTFANSHDLCRSIKTWLNCLCIADFHFISIVHIYSYLW